MEDNSIVKIDSLLNTLDYFKKNFGNTFIVGGSLALYVHGFEHDVHDIDIEYCTSDQNIIEKFKTMSIVYESNQGENTAKYSNKNEHYRFLFNKHIIDVWVVKEFSYNRNVIFKDIHFADIISVLKKKMAMNRIKDYKDFNVYISQLNSLIK